MPRTKSTTTTSTEPKVEVGNTEKNTKEKDPIVEKEIETPKKEKVIADDSEVKVKCISLANKSVIIGDKTYNFDENGIGVVQGKIAKRLITISGYELV